MDELDLTRNLLVNILASRTARMDYVQCMVNWNQLRDLTKDYDNEAEGAWRARDAAWDVHQALINLYTPHPTCCSKAVYLYAWCTTDDDGNVVGAPTWQNSFYVGYAAFREPDRRSVPIHFCPFCGVKLPELRLKAEPPPKVIKTDGYYCFVCDERANACYCLPEITAWEIVP